MSMEDKLDTLADKIEDLTEEIRNLTGLLALQSGIEAGELEMYGSPSDRLALIDEDDERPTTEVEAPVDLTIPLTIEAVHPKTIELINISKRLGIEFIQHGDQLIVDNRVLDEYNRIHTGNNLGG